MKRVVRANMDMEEAVRTILHVQDVSEDEYLSELTENGTRLADNDDAELNLLLQMVSEHAYDLVVVRFCIHARCVSLC